MSLMSSEPTGGPVNGSAGGALNSPTNGATNGLLGNPEGDPTNVPASTPAPAVGFAEVLRAAAAESAAATAGGGSTGAGGDAPADELNFWIELPPGYFPLPLTDIATTLAAAEANLRELAPPEQQELLAAVVDTFTVLLEQLQERDTAYCGLGWHTAEDGAIVPSSLVVSLQRLPQKRNPRLVLKELVELRAEANEHGQVDLVDLSPGPALFFESVLALPRPRLPGQPPNTEPNAGPDADVYQLQAVVPSEDGTRLAAIDFSTPDVAHGTRFRAMMVLMANSVSFTAPPGSPEAGSAARSISQILGGLAP